MLLLKLRALHISNACAAQNKAHNLLDGAGSRETNRAGMLYRECKQSKLKYNSTAIKPRKS